MKTKKTTQIENGKSPMANNDAALEYADRAKEMNQAAAEARILEDARKYASFKQAMAEVQSASVESANIGKELGASFEQYYLPPEREAAENYFNSHYRKALKMSFEVFKWIIQAARKLPEKVESMEDLFPALQPCLFAAGLLEERERSEPQEAHDATPVTLFFERLTKTRVELDKSFAGAERWDEATRREVRNQVMKHMDWVRAALDIIDRAN